MSPQRIQRKRTAGWRMPEGAVYVGRPTLFGNPWTPSDAVAYDIPPHDRRAWCVRQYRRELEHFGLLSDWSAFVSYERWIKVAQLRYESMAEYVRHFLAGKDLVCWCPLDQPCHASVLLEIANA